MRQIKIASVSEWSSFCHRSQVMLFMDIKGQVMHICAQHQNLTSDAGWPTGAFLPNALMFIRWHMVVLSHVRQWIIHELIISKYMTAVSIFSFLCSYRSKVLMNFRLAAHSEHKPLHSVLVHQVLCLCNDSQLGLFVSTFVHYCLTTADSSLCLDKYYWFLYHLGNCRTPVLHYCWQVLRYLTFT